MKYEEEIKRILPKIFKEFFHRYPHLQVFYEHDNCLINNDLMDIDFVQKSILYTDKIDYVENYYHIKPNYKAYRNIYAISLRNNYYLGYLILQYYIETKYPKEEKSIKEILAEEGFIDSLFWYKREYGLEISDAEDFIVRDIKDFYPSLSIKDYASYFPGDKLGLFSKIKKYYNSLYERAGVDFGLLQAPWHSWILADMFLINIDMALQKAKIKFFRDGDSYFFVKDDFIQENLKKIDTVFDAFGMKYTEYQISTKKTLLKAFLSEMYRLKNKSLKSIFPIRIAIKDIQNRRFDIARILKEQIPSRISKEKLAKKLLEIKTWDDFELYHILDWIIHNTINIESSNNFIERYAKSKWFLRAQIRRFLLHNNEHQILKYIFQHIRHENNEKLDYQKFTDMINKSSLHDS
jgi:hypothetical protein